MANVMREVFECRLFRNKERQMLSWKYLNMIKERIKKKRLFYNHKEGKYLNYMLGE